MRIYSKKTISKGFNKIISSNLLAESFVKWVTDQEGNDKFPLDPLNPKNYDIKDFKIPK